jgi:hypothetical protein
MTYLVIFIAAAVFGFAARRWWALGLGLAAGVVTLVMALASGHLKDSPAIVVAGIATLGIALGVIVGQRTGSPEA